MGQKIHPIGYRIGVFEEHRSRWFAGKRDFADLLIEDLKIRRLIKKKHGTVVPPVGQRRSRDKDGPGYAAIPKVEIERTRDEVKVVIHAGKPGALIGKKGEHIDALQTALQNLTGRRVNIKVMEIGRPEIEAQVVAEDIADQLQRRGSFRRTMKRAMEQVMQNGARGVKVELGGRLGGSEMARREKSMLGSVPLATLRARISYGFYEAVTAQGHIGIKVWINQGFYDQEIGDGSDAQAGKVPQKPKRRPKR